MDDATTTLRNVPATPPAVDLDLLKVALPEVSAELDARAKELIAAAERVPAKIEDDDTAGKVATLVKQINACNGELEKQRKATKQPYQDAGTAVDDHYRPVPAALKKAKDKVTAIATAYQQAKAKAAAEEQRRRQEEARAAEEAARKEAEASATDFDAQRRLEEAQRAAKEAAKPVNTAVRGDYGGTSSLRTTYEAEVDDWGALLASPLGKTILATANVRDAIRREVQAEVRAGMRQIPGVTIHEKQVAVVR